MSATARPTRRSTSCRLNRNRARRAAHDELEREQLGTYVDLTARQRPQEELCSAATALEQRLPHGGEADVRGDLDVVEADHGQLLWSADPKCARRLDRTDGLRVRCSEDRCRAFGQREQL